ncbi:MAG TPA: hypothetical protein VMI94_10020 [Bryobacteraceae bacterium]|nr:hypothetical protein [Bryobacteraceae bacterium]
MLNKLVNYLFGCTHARTTFPLTPSRNGVTSPAGQRHGTYVVCLDCGQEFGYDWAEMRIGNPVAARVVSREVALSPVHR